MGDFPLMTDSGTFVINGAERVIVSQLVRSPGVYYSFEKDKTGKNLYKSTVIPNRGAWLEYEMDSNDVVYVRIDKNRKIPLTTFIRALGVGTDEEIEEMFGFDERLNQTIIQKEKIIRMVFLNYTRNFVRVNLRRLKAHFHISTIFSSMQRDMISANSVVTSTTKSLA